MKSEEFWRLSIDAWQNQTKPVKMMYQESKFPLAFIPEMDKEPLLYINCYILNISSQQIHVPSI